MTLQISFDCCLCEFNAKSEEMINYHYLWTHGKWRGNCESPNKINIKSEADNIVKHITDIVKKPGKYDERLNYYDLRECVGLLQRLDELNWAKPEILYRNKSHAEKLLLKEYERYGQNRRTYPTSYKYSKEGAIKQRDFEDKMLENENIVKRLVIEIDEEIKKEKENE